VKSTLRRASQQRSLPIFSIPTPRKKQVSTKREAAIRETSADRATTASSQNRVSALTPKQIYILASTRKGVESSRHPQTLKNPNKPFGEGTSGVKKVPQAQSIRRIFIGYILIDILVAEVMMTSCLEDVTTPIIAKVKFIKPSTTSIPPMVLRTLQIRESTPSPVPIKGKKILHSRTQSQSDLTSNGVELQVYSDSITRLRAKALTYDEVTVQSLVTTFAQGKDQLEEQDEVTRHVFYDLKALFQEEEPLVVISQSQMIEDD